MKNRGGEIVLTDTVDVFLKKKIATETAESAQGVQRVKNLLRVKVEPRTDEEIEENVRWSLRPILRVPMRLSTGWK